MSILVTGASSLVARYLVPLLQARHEPVVLTSRSRPAYLDRHPAAEWIRADLRADEGTSRLPASITSLIHLAPLPLIESGVSALPAHCERIIALGTTSRLTKAGSTDPAEQRMVAEQARAEAWLSHYGAATGASWTLFRPTLIYDGQHDKNVALIARFIRAFGFFPLIGEAIGKRQPLHVADLAAACVLALDNTATFGKAYNLAGGDVLSYREMVDHVFNALGKKPRYARIAPPLLRSALSVARRVPRYRYLSPAMAERMNKDMTFDSSRAARDFGYRPGRFRPFESLGA